MTFMQSRVPNAILKKVAKQKLAGHWGTFIGAFFICFGIEYAITMLAEIPMTICQINIYLEQLNSGSFYDMLLANDSSYTVYTRYPWLIAVMLIVSLVAGAVMAIFNGGEYRMHLELAEDRPVSVKQLFSGFKNRPGRYIVAYILTALITLVPVVIMIPPLVAAILLADSQAGTFAPFWILAFIVLYVYALVTLTLSLTMVNVVLADHPEMRGTDAIKISFRIMNGNKLKLFGLQLSFFGWLFLAGLTGGLLMMYVGPYLTLATTLFYKDATGQIHLTDGEKEYTDYTQYRGDNNDSGK